MAKTKAEKQKARRKAKKKQHRVQQVRETRTANADYFFYEVSRLKSCGEYEEAISILRKALKAAPQNIEMLYEMIHLAHLTQKESMEFKYLSKLYNMGKLDAAYQINLCIFFYQRKNHEKALEIAKKLLPVFSKINIRNKRKVKASIEQIRKLSEGIIQAKQFSKLKIKHKDNDVSLSNKVFEKNLSQKEKQPEASHNKAEPVPEIPVSVEIDLPAFKKALNPESFSSNREYVLTLEAYQIRLKETFDHLICLKHLTNIRSLWYQEETARKVLQSFRGRALLSDEVGLGKTIEALIVLKEYVQRGMVKSMLILTPTPLVSQWQEEMKSKFGITVPSTDDPDYRTKGLEFWEAPFILASINIAKSKVNFKKVTEKEYDMVIVDEAHHLKNRNTLNWKLVNTLKKRFLLFLTATPVENNLMELYNLITLLKPGQLKTATAFRKEFMTKGDPTDPQNKTRLKELLGQVMIRNTRALAKINIPPRFARTIRVDPSNSEKELYERISALVTSINNTNGTGNKLLLKTLLAEAGSSPQAVSRTMLRVIEKKELLLDQGKEIRAINNLCQTMDDTRKNKMLLKLIKSSPGKIIIFVKYIGTLNHLSDFLSRQDIAHVLFHGSINNQKKDEAVSRFKNDVDILVTTEIGGEGRNLQFCNQMINYDLPWNPMKIEQRIGRIHRLGQEKEVMIYNLCAIGSIEDHILEILDKKINMFEMVIGEIDMILGRIRGEQEFSDMVYDIWVKSATGEQRKKSFDELAKHLKRSKTSYQKTKVLDEKLFGENYEL